MDFGICTPKINLEKNLWTNRKPKTCLLQAQLKEYDIKCDQFYSKTDIGGGRMDSEL